MKLLEELASRRRFGMRPGLDAIRAVLAELGNPHDRLANVIHVAGTNGKGAVCAILDAALGQNGAVPVARYTSPHLVKVNERFFFRGNPLSDSILDKSSARVQTAIRSLNQRSVPDGARSTSGDFDLTFFEALTAVAFDAFSLLAPEYSIFETGLGGRLDATNVCRPHLTIITKIGLDHCDWLGETVEKISMEKAGIIKPGVPIVLGRNAESVRNLIQARAKEIGAPYFYAPEIAVESDIPAGFSLAGSFNRENALTAIAALRVLFSGRPSFPSQVLGGFARVEWPGRFQRIGNFIIDGAHNPPAAKALTNALKESFCSIAGTDLKFDLIAGFCADKEVDEVLKILSPFVRQAWAVKTCNPRSLPAEELANRMRKVGICAKSCDSLKILLQNLGPVPKKSGPVPKILICGSLFLAGEAVQLLGGYSWGSPSKIDPSELLNRHSVP